MSKQEKIKPEILKPFTIKHYQFFPCSYNESKKDGYKYFLLIRNRKGIIYSEIDSPRFKSKQDAQEYVDKNEVHSFVIG